MSIKLICLAYLVMNISIDLEVLLELIASKTPSSCNLSNNLRTPSKR
jgi:hypothetical protein